MDSVERSPAEAEKDEDRAVLGLLLDAYPALLSLDEITREVGDRVAVEDALARSHRVGLIHRIEVFAFPTRAAIRSRQLDSC